MLMVEMMIMTTMVMVTCLGRHPDVFMLSTWRVSFTVIHDKSLDNYQAYLQFCDAIQKYVYFFGFV